MTGSIAVALPNSSTSINFNQNVGTLTGSVTAADFNFNNFGTWVLQGATLNIAGLPNPPFGSGGGNFNTDVVLNGATINGSGSSFNINATNGATVTASNNSTVVTTGDNLGSFNGQSGSLVLSGVGTTWQEVASSGSSGYINIGIAGAFSPGQTGGTGYLTVTNGASLVTAGNADLGQNLGNIGSATISAGGYWGVGSGGIQVGGFGAGMLSVSGGTLSTTGFVGVGNNSGGSGTVTVSSTSHFLLNGLSIGGNGTGFMSVTGGTVTNSGGLSIGTNAGGSGTLVLSTSGTLLNAGFANIGLSAGSTGVETVTTGAVMTDSGMDVGASGLGVLTVNGGTVSSAPTLSAGTLVGGFVSVGANLGGDGSVSVAGSGHFDMNGMSVGGSGTGTLTLGGNSEITNSSGLTVGANNGALGIVSVTGANLTVAGNTVIGNAGDGTLTVNSVGSIVANGGFVGIGNNAGGVGELAINGGGLFKMAGSSIAVGNNAGASGELIIAGGGTLQFTEAPQLVSTALSIGHIGTTGTIPAATGNVLVTGIGSLLEHQREPVGDRYQFKQYEPSQYLRRRQPYRRARRLGCRRVG